MDRWPGDIIGRFPRASGGGGEQSALLSETIVGVSQISPRFPPSHILVNYDATRIVQMTYPAMDSALWDDTAKDAILWHWRWQGISDGQRQAIADWMWSRRGWKYGTEGLVFDALDALFCDQVASQLLGLPGHLVCSAAAHQASKEGAGRGVRLAPGGKLLRPASTTPAHWEAAAVTWPDDLLLLETNLTDEEKDWASAKWEAKQVHILDMAEIATAGWPPPGA